MAQEGSLGLAYSKLSPLAWSHMIGRSGASSGTLDDVDGPSWRAVLLSGWA